MNKWQPIETAPYSVNLLLWISPIKDFGVGRRVFSARERKAHGTWWVNHQYYRDGVITHWMPLPEPPEEET